MPDPLYRLKSREIHQRFMATVLDLKRILVWDEVDMLESGFRIHCHDLYGPLPVIEIEETLERYPTIELLEQEAAQLCAIVGMRAKLVSAFPGCTFLPPTITDTGYLVGLNYQKRVLFGEDKTHWEAYHRLMAEARIQ
jgi:hypothetical protein